MLYLIAAIGVLLDIVMHDFDAIWLFDIDVNTRSSHPFYELA